MAFIAWQGGVAAALECYEEAHRLSPGNTDAMAWLTTVYIKNEVRSKF
jgi:cytochrome c-type biogenesis protein CcmH/NrfG